MNRSRNTFVGLALPLFVVSIASAQAYTYSQSFDALPSSGAAADITGTTTPPLGSQGALTALSAVDCSWQACRLSGTGTAAMKLTVDTGAANTGTVYSYGATASANRSLGSIASGTTVPAFGVALTNHTGSTLTTITVTFKGQQWRSPSDSSLTSHGVVNTLKFSYGFSPTGMTNSNFLSSALMTDEAAGNVVSGAPTAFPNVSVGLVELGLNTVTLTGVTWNSGDVFYMRWQDTNDAANDAGLAIDDLTVTADADDACFGDLDGSGEVDAGDIGLVLLDFGPCPGCSTDLDGSGEVDSADIGLILLSFGPCQ